MNAAIAVLTAVALALSAGLAQARDLSPEEALKLHDAGTIQPFEKLNATALAQHPGGKIEDSGLEDKYGRYVYQLKVRDAQGVKWAVELDATNGQLLKNQRDD